MINRLRMREKYKNNKAVKICFVLLIVVLLEVFLFNFRFFQTMGYEPVYMEEAILGDNVELTDESVVKFKDNSSNIGFENIDTEVKNIYIDVENTDVIDNIENIEDINTRYKKIKDAKSNLLIKVKIKIDDESNSAGIDMPERSLVSNIERTKYINMNLYGKSENITITFSNAQDKELKINEIAFNKPVPFSFSIIRVLVLLVIIAVLYILRPNSEFYKYKLNIKSSKQKVVLLWIAVLQIVLMISASHINPMYVYNTISWQNQYNELAEAILDGHFYLNEEPDVKLSEIDNPYDPNERTEANISVKWDHAYYEGKYYVYFGIVPALLFNIPARLIADVEIKPFTCILILIPIFIVLSYLLIYELAKKFIGENKNNIGLLIYVMLCTLFVNGIGTAFLMVWPDMYTLPIFTAVTLAVGGLYFWISAFKKSEDSYRLSKIKLFIGSLFMALIAGCRPQLILVIFAAVPLFWNAVFKERKLFSKSGIVESICFVLPIAAFALFMFYYNYSRFGSVFEFGAKYNLTTNDITARGLNVALVPQGVFRYLLQPLNVEGVFPYVTTVSSNTLYMGSNYCEGTYGGFLFLQPLVWVCLLIPKVKDELKKRGLFALTVFFIAIGVLIAVADAIMGGILSRYFIDFGFLLVLPSIIVVFAVYEKYNGKDYINVFRYFMPVCFVISMFITFAITIGGKYYTPAETNPDVFWKIATAVQFWL